MLNKHKKRWLILIVFVIVVIGVIAISFYVKDRLYNNQYSVTEPYDYPMEIGSEEWLALPNSSWQREAFYLPDGLPQEMTTEALMETIVANPYIADRWAYGKRDEGLDHILKYVNGFYELVEREDFEKEFRKMKRQVSKQTDEESITKDMRLEVVWEVYEYVKK